VVRTPLRVVPTLRRPGRLGLLVLLVLPLSHGARVLSAAADDTRGGRIVAEPAPLGPEAIASLHGYIDRTWETLTRSLDDLPGAAVDPKLPVPADGRWPVYVPDAASLAEVAARLRRELAPDALSHLDLRVLPADRGPAFEHGLLFLPRPYVVPGGRFNEMYGWDSYFILVGLLRSGRVALARDMVDNFLYEIRSYGKVLNANRTYYLTRSQPPFLTEMILGVYRATSDQGWLRGTLPAVEAFHSYWTRPPHALDQLGLARYADSGSGPAPEVVAAERDAQGRPHYDLVREHFRGLAGRGVDVTRFYDASSGRLTEAFYDADRAMRESGFDPTGRFGPLGAETLDIAPVGLNALLYSFERDLAEMHGILGDGPRAREWRERADRRREAVDRFLWDPERGLYLDYDLRARARRDYLFATTFYPLWVGLSTPDQAERVVAAALPRLEARCGLLTSDTVSGSQWDAPYGWAPLQLIAVDGLRRYGFEAAARRLALKFLGLVSRDFSEHGTIVEKYDVERCASDLGEGLRFGYASNEVGFGWTNGVALELLADLAEPDIR
jgi:alpha,alpha-trehalase